MSELTPETKGDVELPANTYPRTLWMLRRGANTTILSRVHGVVLSARTPTTSLPSRLKSIALSLPDGLTSKVTMRRSRSFHTGPNWQSLDL